MQYTTKLVLLAAALGTTALAGPLTVHHSLEAREVDTDILGAREYLEARQELPPVAAPIPNEPDAVVSMSAAPQYEGASNVDGSASEGNEASPSPEHHHGHHCGCHPFHVKPTKEQMEELANPSVFKEALANEDHRLHKVAEYILWKELAQKELEESSSLYQTALFDEHHPHHLLVIEMEFFNPVAFHAALNDNYAPLHRAAKYLQKHREIETYLADESNYKKALHNKKSKYHEDAVEKYLSNEEHFDYALHHKRSRYHKTAINLYFSDPKHLLRALTDKESRFHKAAVRFERNRMLREEIHAMNEALHVVDEMGGVLEVVDKAFRALAVAPLLAANKCGKQGLL